jgi:hypothetical protein
MACHRIVAVAFLLAAIVTSGFGQSPSSLNSGLAKDSGVISGRITLNGKPISGIEVRLRVVDPNDLFSRRILDSQAHTDREGKFRLTGVPAGSFNVTPEAGPYVVPKEGFYGFPGKGVVIQAGEEVKGVDFELVAGGVISGRITDMDGSPVIGQKVIVESVDEQGSRRLVAANAPSDTDDRGIYRLYGLAQGKYLISVRAGSTAFGMSSNEGPGVQVYYPGVGDQAKAEAVELREAGTVASNVDFKLISDSNSYSASGHLIDALTGQPLANTRYGFAEERNVIRPTNGSIKTDANGEFHINHLSPGRYVVYGVPSSDNAYSDVHPFTITDSSVRNLEVKIHPGASVAGTVVLEDQSKPATSFTGLTAMLGQPDGSGGFSNARGTVNADGTFNITGVRPGKASLSIESAVTSDLAVTHIQRNGTEQPAGINISDGETVAGVRVFIAYSNCNIRGEVRRQNDPGAGIKFRVALSRGNQVLQVAETDAQDRFFFAHVSSGDYQLVVVPFSNSDPTAAKQIAQVKQNVSINGGTNEVSIQADLMVKRRR